MAILVSQIALLTVIAALSGCRSEAAGQRQAPTLTTTAAPAAPQLPTNLHFSAADIAYLESVDARTREVAIQLRRDEVQARQQAAKLTQGYTDSLKNWSISTSRPRTPRRK